MLRNSNTYQLCIQELKDICLKKSVSIPKIGSGLDKKSWNVTEKFFNKTFKETEIKVSVYSLVKLNQNLYK